MNQPALRTAWPASLAAALLQATSVSAEPFRADEATMLLASFDSHAYEADHASGAETFTGSGAQLRDGYYGKAVDLRGLQFVGDFRNRADTPLACYYGFGIRPHGNVNLQQGTYELWFKFGLASENGPQGGRLYKIGSALFRATYMSQVKKPEDKWHKDLSLTISTGAISYCFPFLPNDYEDGSVRISPALGRDEWHHVAICWSKGEFVGYLDGRPFFTTDMSERRGFAFACNIGISVMVNGIILDELRISDVVRYETDFEPNWVDGKRPAHAFAGIPGLKRYPANTESPVRAVVVPLPSQDKPVENKLGSARLLFDRSTGVLRGFGFGAQIAKRGANGLLLFDGLAHDFVPAARATDWRVSRDRIAFVQQFENQIRASHQITGEDGIVRWRVSLLNEGETEAWTEALLSLPVPFDRVCEFFDGSWIHRDNAFPRRRDEYVCTMPLAAASGETMSIGVGLDPHVAYNALVAEWLPEDGSGTIRQGAKLALSPGERYACEFLLVTASADFRALDALEAYQDCSPDLYRLLPDVPVYSYLPVGASIWQESFHDLYRLTYTGGFWGHGPGHDQSDYYGTTRWWDNPKYYGMKSYKYTAMLEGQYYNLATLRKLIKEAARVEFDSFYPVRRIHTCPDMPPQHITDDLWPGYRPNGDPLARGQYYYPYWQWWMSNEHDTPIGQHVRNDVSRYYREAAPHIVGFINDMSDLGVIRHDDPIAKASSGRAFSRDKGTYVLGHCGRLDRYKMINSFVDNGHRSSIWSDGGFCSYVLCAYSSAQANETCGEHYGYLTAHDPYFVTARYMMGEKPHVCILHVWTDKLALFFKPEQFTPEGLREYYRYRDSQLFLRCVKLGMDLCAPQVLGRHELMERYPIVIESTVLGRRTHPGGFVAKPLWMVRAGRGLDAFLVVGNEKPQPHKTSIQLVNRCFGGTPLFGPYFGGEATHSLERGKTEIENVQVGARDAQAFRCLGRLSGDSGPGQVRTEFSGDGIAIRVKMDIALSAESSLELNTFDPIYGTGAVRINGKSVPYARGEALALPRGPSVVEAEYNNLCFSFTKAEWDSVDLIRGGKTNFCILADAGMIRQTHIYRFPIGFERGTAMMLNHFLWQYDEEDGVVGNLGDAPLCQEKPAGFRGWAVVLKNDALAGPGKVHLDAAAREIVLTGRSPGEVRGAMVALLRLIDRKYPHVGRLLPLQSLATPHMPKNAAHNYRSWPVEDPLQTFFGNDKPSVDFFRGFADRSFALKPILKPECESLYADDNRDFAGKYTMRFAPYIFEPTYADNFVHGYKGPPEVETDAELSRTVRKGRAEILEKMTGKE